MRTCTTCNQRFSGDATFCPFDGTKLEGIGNAATQLSLRPPEEMAPGTVIGGTYRIDRVLGEGGMGIVFAVTHTKLGKRFALKLLKRDLARDPETRARFLLEAQAAGQIRHPNVVEITDFASLPDGSAYLVMEYLDGQPLSRMIKLGGAIPALRAVSIVRDVANALQAAHDAGIVHRDLKPDNVFVLQIKDGHGSREIAKILDFGVAKVAGSAKLTRTGMVFGTPHYMSPEQASGGAIDARTDIYALGVIMYEMFTGRVPFEADTYMGVLTKHMFETPTPPSQVAGPARELGALEDLTLRALAKRPEDRYASMRDLVADLDRIIQVGPDGRAVVASKVEGLSRPDFRRSLTPSYPPPPSLADELEPPARAELAAATANARERRVRTLGAFILAFLLAAAIVVTTTVARRRGAEGTASVAPSPSPTMRPVEPPPPVATSATPKDPPPAASNSVATESSASSTQSATTASTKAATNPPPPPHAAPSKPPTKPPKPPSGGSDIEDPWAK